MSPRSRKRGEAIADWIIRTKHRCMAQKGKQWVRQAKQQLDLGKRFAGHPLRGLSKAELESALFPRGYTTRTTRKCRKKKKRPSGPPPLERSKVKTYAQYLKAKHWQKLRQKILERDCHVCQECGRKSNLVVHHVVYRGWFKEQPEDLIAWCAMCHDEHHRTNEIKIA